MRFLFLFLASLMLSAPLAEAEPEVHMVGIYEGLSQTDGQMHGPRARVLLDRPEAEVILVLSSYEAVRWEVELGRDTPAPSVVLAQAGNDGRRSEVWLNGQLLEAPVRMPLPLTYQPEGVDFRALVRLVPERFGVVRLASFSGSYSASEYAFEITDPVDDPRYDIDYLRGQLSAGLVPESLRPLIGLGAVTAPPDLRLTDRGFEVLSPEGAQLIALPLDMPGVSWPMGAVRHAETGTLYGVTLGGEGLLFAYDEALATWRIARSMEGLDAQALFLDAAGRRLIMPLGFGAPGRIAVLALRAGEDSPIRIVTPARAFPGYADLYDPGNGPEPNLVPVGIEGDKLLLVTQGEDRYFAGQGADGATPPWRAYLVDLSAATVDLVGYKEALTAD